MVSVETKSRLAKLLIILAEGERAIEISRQVLSDCYDFNAYQIFQNLDFENKKYVDARDIIGYLQLKGISASLEEAQLIILFYDRDYDGILNYGEFLKLVQSEKSTQKFIKDFTGKLSFNIDYSLSKLLEKEIDLAQQVITCINDIQSRYDFNIHNLFHELKSWNCISDDSIRHFLQDNGSPYLESDIRSIRKRMDLNGDGRIDLCEFHALLGFPGCCHICPNMACKRCGACYCDNCFCAVPCFYHGCVHHNSHCSRRAHSPCNCQKTYNEKEDDLLDDKRFLLPQRNEENNENNENRPNNLNQKKNNMSPPQQMKSIQNPNDMPIYEDPDNRVSGSLSLRKSPERIYGPKVIGTCVNCNTVPCLCCPDCQTFPCKCPDKRMTSSQFNTSRPPLNNYTTMNSDKNFDRNRNVNPNNNYLSGRNNYNYNISDNNSYEEKNFIEFLKMVMDIETQIEGMKTALSYREDFNVEDAFRIFEINAKAKILPEELAKGFILLGIPKYEFDIDLFIKRFDLQGNNYITYPDFFDILVPFQKEQRFMVENRKPNSKSAQDVNAFSPGTIVSLNQLFNFIIEKENQINVKRRQLTSLNMHLEDIFRSIGNSDKGYFTINEFSNYLKKKRIFSNNTACDLLFIRLDRNRNGRIDLKEIRNEVTALI